MHECKLNVQFMNMEILDILLSGRTHMTENIFASSWLNNGLMVDFEAI